MISRTLTTFIISTLMFLVALPQVAFSGNNNICFEEALQHALVNSFPKMDGETVEAFQKIQGQHGGFRYKLRRKEFQDWLGLGNKNAPQGSPLWAFQFLDPQTAGFLGFAKDPLGEWVVVPDHEEWIGALKKLNLLSEDDNSKLIQAFPYLQKEGHSPIEKHLYRYVKNGEYPWGEEGDFFHHDLYVHALSNLFIPTEIALHSRKQFKTFFDFGKYLYEHHPKLLQDPRTQLFFKRSFAKLSNFLDKSTGTLSSTLGSIINKPFSERGLVGVREIQKMTAEGASPKEFFEGFAGLIQKSNEISLDEDFNKIEAEFIAYKLKADPTFDTALPEIKNLDQVRSKILKRVEEVKNAVKLYKELGLPN